MSSVALEKPILDDGIRTVNFFNGRLLSGEDLTQEQAANREARHLLGQAIGDGVAFGLEVAETVGVSTKTSPVVTVKAGLAVNRQGQTLRLTRNTDVSLVRPLNGSTAAPAGTVFVECQPPQSGVYVAGEGVYLLTIAPASAGEGRAPVSGLGNVTAACNTRYTVESIQFRLLQLDLSSSVLADDLRLRNSVAYQCFGVEALQSFIRNPFGPTPERSGLLDELRPRRLTDHDVPLALVHWTTAGIQFIDMWSVRRRVTRPIATVSGHIVGDDRRLSEAEAMVLQFANHLETLRATVPNPASLRATQVFHYLPPVGILPLAGAGTVPGFDFRQLFAQRVYHEPVFIEGARVESLIRAALVYPPIDLRESEMVWLYLVRENRDPRAFAGNPTPLPYLIFTSGHLPPQTDARFDVNRWNYSNYAIA